MDHGDGQRDGWSDNAGTSRGRKRDNSVHVKSLDHIHIYAANPEQSAEFYQRHFEAKQAHRNVNSNGDVRIFLALGGQIVVVGSFPVGMASVAPPEAGDGAYVHGFGIAHFGLRVEDLEASIDELATAGVRVIGEVVQEPAGLSYAYVEAPDGVVLELTQYE
jgi:catechol 2,3-dioxygenase-like lactoylglutathione lyase family enzyme